MNFKKKNYHSHESRITAPKQPHIGCDILGETFPSVKGLSTSIYRLFKLPSATIDSSMHRVALSIHIPQDSEKRDTHSLITRGFIYSIIYRVKVGLLRYCVFVLHTATKINFVSSSLRISWNDLMFNCDDALLRSLAWPRLAIDFCK